MTVSRATRVIASRYKIIGHHDRVERFLAGHPILPVTLELGLTTSCNRQCPDCPSGLGKKGTHIDPGIVESLFSALAGKTPGLIITGGEPTLYPHFAETLALAARVGRFEEIAVITNGSRLEDEAVAASLVAHADAVRVSLYDFDKLGPAGIEGALTGIRSLHRRARAAGSSLSIGVSVLTSSQRTEAFAELCTSAREAGAGWCYFHPTCLRDVEATIGQQRQDRVIETLRDLRSRQDEAFDVFFLEERYTRDVPCFAGYHAAHFICVVAADGKNYLSTESKFLPEFVLADLNAGVDGFLEDRRRRARIDAVGSDTYHRGGGRNRGILYSDLLQRLIDGSLTLGALERRCETWEFVTPAIL